MKKIAQKSVFLAGVLLCSGVSLYSMTRGGEFPSHPAYPSNPEFPPLEQAGPSAAMPAELAWPAVPRHAVLKPSEIIKYVLENERTKPGALAKIMDAIALGGNPNIAAQGTGLTALSLAVTADDWEAVKQLLRLGG